MTKSAEERIILARQCQRAIRYARRELGHDLGGMSMLGLVAARIEEASLADLKDALFIAGIEEKS